MGSLTSIAVQSSGDNAWGNKESFVHNSPCKEDNPELYAGGTKLIFESNRKEALGDKCNNEEKVQLWCSEKVGDSWTTPVVLAGEPNEGKKNTQAWVDEVNNYLYWTNDEGCGCVRRMPFDGASVYGSAEDVVIPNTKTLWEGGADGQVVFVGEYSQSENVAFITCGIAREGGPFLKKWSITINACVIPLN